MEGKCYCYKKSGHKFLQGRYKDKPKSEWAINKHLQSYAQTSKQASKKTEAPPTPTSQATNPQFTKHQNTG
jgi:hypothetical protein